MTEVHPQIRALLDADAGMPRSDLAALRAGYVETAERLGGPVVAVALAEDVTIERPDGTGLGARAYVPFSRADAPGAIVWHHGGGWVLGDLDGFDRVARELAEACGHVVISVDYRLAPEHPYPAAVEDGTLALRWAAGPGAARFGFDGSRLAIGGDSAGGQVAVGAMLRAGGPARAQLLVYPALDHEMGSAAYERFADGPMLTAGDMAWFWEAYVSGGRAPDPVTAEQLAQLPPAWIALAGHDPLRDDGDAYATGLRAAGAIAHVRVFEDMTHGFLRMGGIVDTAHELVRWLADAARAELAS